MLVLFSAPLVIMLSGSLRKPGLPPPRTPELLPDPVVFSNYERGAIVLGAGLALTTAANFVS